MTNTVNERLRSPAGASGAAAQSTRKPASIGRLAPTAAKEGTAISYRGSRRSDAQREGTDHETRNASDAERRPGAGGASPLRRAGIRADDECLGLELDRQLRLESRPRARDRTKTKASRSPTSKPHRPTRRSKNVPNVYGPGLTAAGSEGLLGIGVGGRGRAGLAVTIGGTIVDQECQLRHERAHAGDPRLHAKAAREEMCVDPQVRAAMAAAGTPCVADELAKPQATAEYEGPAPGRSPADLGARLPQRLRTVGRLGPTSARLARRRPMRRSQRLRPKPSLRFLRIRFRRTRPSPTATGCTKKYQLIGGWYDDCK